MEDKRLLKLVKKARRGDKNAFCQLIEEKGRKIIFIATNLMGNASDGEDAAQEAVITLARKIGSLKRAELFDAWMYRIIYNVCMDELRRKKRKVEDVTDLESAAIPVVESDIDILPEKKLETSYDREAIMAALNELPERYRMCILLYYYENMTYAEIAETLQVSEQVVANTLNRAKEKLRINFEYSLSDRQLVPALAHKGGAFLPAAAITTALTQSESLMVLPDAVAGLTAVAAGVTLPSGLLFQRFVEGAASKVVAGVACAAIATGAAATVVPEVVPDEQSAYAPAIIEDSSSSTSETTSQTTPLSERVITPASVNGLPEGAQSTTYMEGDDDEGLAAFLAHVDNYTSVTEMTDDQYRYVLYQSNADPLEYVLTVQGI